VERTKEKCVNTDSFWAERDLNVKGREALRGVRSEYQARVLECVAAAASAGGRIKSCWVVA